MRVRVTGADGFFGPHWCESFLKRSDFVLCVDDLSTKRQSNIATFAYSVMPLGILTSSEAAQSALHLVGRFLLRVSMTMFLSYLLFMVGAIVVAGLLGRVRSVRKRLAQDVAAASAVRPRHRSGTSTPRPAAMKHRRREQRP